MAKYYGSIGFLKTNDETSPGVYTEIYDEVSVKGEILQNSRRIVSGESINDDVTINNKISIAMDPSIFKKYHSIRYATYMGSKWKVDSVEVANRRLILTLGGIYNG